MTQVEVSSRWLRVCVEVVAPRAVRGLDTSDTFLPRRVAVQLGVCVCVCVSMSALARGHPKKSESSRAGALSRR